MPDAWNSIKIRDFEQVLAGGSVALLRVSGKPRRRHSDIGPRPVLLADDGQTVRRFVAIPSPSDERGVLRAAYSVSSDLVGPSTVFSLELTDGNVIALPEPRPGESRLVREPEAKASPETAEPTERPPAADERRSGLVSKLTELSARLAEADQRADDVALELAALQERADELQSVRQQLEQASEEQREHQGRLENDLAEAVAARDELERSVPPMRAAREQAEAQAEKATASVQELETWSGELERRLTEATDELSAAKTARARDEDELSRLGGELSEAEAKVELLQDRIKTLNDARYSSSERESIVRRAGELAALLGGAERLTELARELSEARAQAESLQAAVSAAPEPQVSSGDDELTSAREEIEQLQTQLAQARDAEAEARIDAIRHAAEAEARELAERELAQATTVGQ